MNNHPPQPHSQSELDAALLVAATNADSERLYFLLEAGANPNAKNADGNYALTLAVNDNNPYRSFSTAQQNEEAEDRCAAALQVLLEAGANPNLKNAEGRTALSYAYIKSNYFMMAILLEFGAVIEDTESVKEDLESRYHKTLPNINFCLGALHEQVGNTEEAKKYYKIAMQLNYTPALSRYGALHENTNLELAIQCYIQGLQQGDYLAATKLMELAKKAIIANHYLSHIPLSAHLSSANWDLLAISSIGSPDYASQVDAIQFALAAARKAIKFAKTAEEMDTAKATLTSTLNIFKQMMRPDQPYALSDMIVDYGADAKAKESTATQQSSQDTDSSAMQDIDNDNNGNNLQADENSLKKGHS